MPKGAKRAMIYKAQLLLWEVAASTVKWYACVNTQKEEASRSEKGRYICMLLIAKEQKCE